MHKDTFVIQDHFVYPIEPIQTMEYCENPLHVLRSMRNAMVEELPDLLLLLKQNFDEVLLQIVCNTITRSQDGYEKFLDLDGWVVVVNSVCNNRCSIDTVACVLRPVMNQLRGPSRDFVPDIVRMDALENIYDIIILSNPQQSVQLLEHLTYLIAN